MARAKNQIDKLQTSLLRLSSSSAAAAAAVAATKPAMIQRCARGDCEYQRCDLCWRSFFFILLYSALYWLFFSFSWLSIS